MTAFQDFLAQRLSVGGFSTEDALVSFLPLVRETLEAHAADCVAPLEGLAELRVENNRIWFEKAKQQSLRTNSSALRTIQAKVVSGVEIVSETRRTSAANGPEETVINLAIAERGQAVTQPVYLDGYVAWEHEVEHHDPLTDIFSLGMILASLACSLDFTDPDDLRRFVESRDNLFRIQPGLHPVLARAITKMTEVDRHQRAQDLGPLLTTLENYRDQEVDFDFDLARIGGLDDGDQRNKQQVILTKLRERLFELSRRNRLLHFRTTMQSVNLTHSSVPLSFDVKNIRPDSVLVWNDNVQREFMTGKPVSLNKFLNFAEAIYLPSVLDRTIAEARRDQAEFGFAQLRLVVCFLHWANLKEKPIEQFDSPLVLVPVKLTKKKGIRDTYWLEVVESEAEINPVVRHQFKQLYDIDLPEHIDLTKSTIDDFFAYLAQCIESSDVSVTLKKVDRPRISLIHDQAKRRLDQYRRRARLAGRGIRRFLDLEYSYDPANYHPLGIKLFSARVRTPENKLRAILEEKPRPRSYMNTPEEAGESVKERSFFSIHEGGEDNPYTWTFDLCSVTLANFKYRKMSLVRDYDALMEQQPVNEAFDAVFSSAPRDVDRELPDTPPLESRYDVVPCDPTQATAIEEAHGGGSYIIQGPPGTGKSQTITNLIADYAAHGKRVLFVCEKRAAIDVVFARLRQCGLQELCCLIHDSQTDKKDFVMDLKQTYERFLEAPPPQKRAFGRDRVLKRMSTAVDWITQFDAQMTEPRAAAGMSLRELLDRWLALSDSLPELTMIEAERLPDYAEWNRYRAAINQYAVSLSHVQPNAIAVEHPCSIVAPRLAASDHPIDTVSSAAEAAQQQIVELQRLMVATDLPAECWNTLTRCEQLVRYARQVQSIASCKAGMALCDSTTEVATQFRDALGQLENKTQSVAEAAKKTESWRERLPAAEMEVAIQQARSFDTKRFKWFSPAWWRLRGIMHRCYDFKAHVVKPGWVQVLEWLQTEYERQQDVQQHCTAMQRDFGISSDVTTFCHDFATVQHDLKDLPDGPRAVHAILLKSHASQSVVERILGAESVLQRTTTELRRFTDHVDDSPFDQLQDRLEQALDCLEDLPDILEAYSELAEVPSDISRVLCTFPLSPTQLEAACVHRCLDDCYRQARQLSRNTGRDRIQQALKLQRWYDRWLEANAREIRTRVATRFQDTVHICSLPASQLTAEQKQLKKYYNRGRRTLEHEFGKSMRYKPIRELVSGDSGEVVKDLKPIWLMSPLSVSDTLPLDTDHFDVVIFDEASQITLEEAIPSLFRATQSIVVGDEMQLPPTDFFSSKQSTEEDDDLTFEEDGEMVQYDLESNSFLNHAAKNLQSTMLGWHYRSRSESLISFSNWKFYDGRLLTVPEETIPGQVRPEMVAQDAGAADAGADALLERSVSFHSIANGVYENRRNRAEADYIAAMVRRLIMDDDESGKTIGVVAFSEAQQAEIEGALTQLAADDQAFANRLEAEYEREEDGQFVGLLVKNLENIQGDERDIIILSVCYAPGPNGKMRMNFGPINKSGGEKRLNVAFSRAKHHMAVVSTIKHTQITNDYNDGANCLKQYLRYAEAVSVGDPDTATGILHGISRWRTDEDQLVAKSVLSEQIAAALRKHDYVVDEQVGQSHLRCDLAVRREGDATYRLGILVDTNEHYQQDDVLERDVMRPRLLRGFGWRLTHTIAKDWQADQGAELERLLRLLAGAEDPWLHYLEADESEDDEQDQEEADAPAPEAATEGAKTPQVEPEVAELLEPTEDVVAHQDQCYLEFSNETSNKFWEITLNARSHTVRFGRIGSQGQTRTKTFGTPAEARGDFDRLIRQKRAKGYQDAN